MPQRIREVMTPDPKTLPKTATVKEAAELMRDDDIGDVIIVNAHKKLYGILTDRDIAVRVVPTGEDPGSVTLEDVATKDVASLGPEATVEEAVALMRDRAIRRLPICEDGKPVGVVSLGDLAIERDPQSALADISAAPPDEPVPSANGSGMRDLGKTLPAVAAGAGLALTVDYLRNRNKRRSVKMAAKRLRRTGRKLRRSGDKTASEATAQAAKYAAAAAAVIRSQGKRMKKEAGDAGEEIQDRAEKLSRKAKRAGRKADNKGDKLGRKAERRSKDFAEFAEDKSKELKRKAKDLSKLAERKAENVKEKVGAGRH